MIDDDVRIDDGALRHVLTAENQTGERRPKGNLDLLQEVISEGHAYGEIVESFSLQRLAARENFLSVLYYFGLLTIRGETAETPQLAIPNRTVRRLLHGFLRDANGTCAAAPRRNG